MKIKKSSQIVTTRTKLAAAINQAVSKILVLFIAAAMDEFDWTDGELDRFAERLKRYYDAVDEHLISTEKIKKIVEDIMGVKIC